MRDIGPFDCILTRCSHSLEIVPLVNLHLTSCDVASVSRNHLSEDQRICIRACWKNTYCICYVSVLLWNGNRSMLPSSSASPLSKDETTFRQRPNVSALLLPDEQRLMLRLCPPLSPVAVSSLLRVSAVQQRTLIRHSARFLRAEFSKFSVCEYSRSSLNGKSSGYFTSGYGRWSNWPYRPILRNSFIVDLKFSKFVYSFSFEKFYHDGSKWFTYWKEMLSRYFSVKM